MNIIKNKLRIALDRPLERSSVSVKKNDTNTREICFTLTQRGGVYSLENVRIAAIKGVKPDGNIIYNTCVIDDNEIQYTITSQSINVEGTVKCELVLYGSKDEVINSAKFEIEVFNNIFDENVLESVNEFTMVNEIINECNSFKEEAQTAATEASVSATSALEAKETIEINLTTQRGQYTQYLSYSKYDIVFYNDGRSYMAAKDIPAGIRPAESTYWICIFDSDAGLNDALTRIQTLEEKLVISEETLDTSVNNGIYIGLT